MYTEYKAEWHMKEFVEVVWYGENEWEIIKQIINIL